MKIKLDDFIRKQQEKISELENNIAELEKINLPVSIEIKNSKVLFYSDDYSVATGYYLEIRETRLGGESYPDGGYKIYRKEIYPQFYCLIDYIDEQKKVLIQHNNFEKDKDIIIKSDKITTGWKDYRNENKKISERNDIEQVILFFQNKGVPQNILDDLKQNYQVMKKLIE
jgi:hypothetical protein